VKMVSAALRVARRISRRLGPSCWEARVSSLSATPSTPALWMRSSIFFRAKPSLFMPVESSEKIVSSSQLAACSARFQEASLGGNDTDLEAS